MKQTLILLRHANAAVWAAGIDDAGRQLSNSGQKHASLVATWMHQQMTPPDSILCSPAVRTRQTLGQVLQNWPELHQQVQLNKDRFRYGCSQTTRS